MQKSKRQASPTQRPSTRARTAPTPPPQATSPISVTLAQSAATEAARAPAAESLPAVKPRVRPWVRPDLAEKLGETYGAFAPRFPTALALAATAQSPHPASLASPRARLAAARQADGELEAMQAATLPRQAPNVRNGTPSSTPGAKRAPPGARGGMRHSRSQPAPSRTPQPQPQEPQLSSSAPLRRTSSGAVLLPGTAYTEYLIYASQHRLAGYGTPPLPPHSLPPIADAWAPDAGDGPETGEEAPHGELPGRGRSLPPRQSGRALFH